MKTWSSNLIPFGWFSTISNSPRNLILDKKKFDLWPKLWFLTKISILINNRFSAKISFFDQNLDFRLKFQFLTNFLTQTSIFKKIMIFHQNLYFWLKFQFVAKIYLLSQIFDSWPKYRFLAKILIFGKNFVLLTKISNSVYGVRPLF